MLRCRHRRSSLPWALVAVVAASLWAAPARARKPVKSPPRGFGVLLSPPTIGGALSRASAMSVIGPGRRKILACYKAAAAKRPKLVGHLVLHLAISAKGRVKATRTTGASSGLGARLPRCVRRVAKAWRFSRIPGGGVATVSQRLVFRQRSGGLPLRFARLTRRVGSGALSRTVIRAVIRRHIRRIRQCFVRLLQRNPNAKGRLAARFRINRRGSVDRALIINRGGLRDARMRLCVKRAVLRMRFPRPVGGGVVMVTYPFVFRSTGSSPTKTRAWPARGLSRRTKGWIAVVARRHHADVRRCYGQRLAKKLKLRGRVLVQIDLRGDGRVAGARVKRASLRLRSVARCLALAVTKWVFPPGPRGAHGPKLRVVHPFEFK